MRKEIYVCDHCGAEFTSNGYGEIQLDDLDFVKEVDLCTDCYNELCDMIKNFMPRRLSEV